MLSQHPQLCRRHGTNYNSQKIATTRSLTQVSMASTLRQRAAQDVASLGDVAHAIQEKIANTLHWHELEHWQRDNEFIIRGYRKCVS